MTTIKQHIDPSESCATCGRLTPKNYCPFHDQQVKTPDRTTCRERLGGSA